MKSVNWNENGWTRIQDADAAKHILEVSCYCDNGMVVEVKIRHNDGEDKKATVTCNGENVLPINHKEFQKLFDKKKLELR